MNLPELFRTYLIDKKNLSRVSAKNYVADVNKFLRWFESNFKVAFTPSCLTSDVITLFKNTKGGTITESDEFESSAAARSFERYMSTLRRFASFLKEEGYIESNPFDSLIDRALQAQVDTDPWKVKGFKEFLYVTGASKVTSKNYVVDILAFTAWAESALADKISSDNSLQALTSDAIEEYKTRLIEVLGLSHTSVNRKLSSIRKYLQFAMSQGYLENEIASTLNVK